MIRSVLALGKISTLLFASSPKFSFQNERLKNAAELYEEAQELSTKGQFQEACEVHMQGIFLGRKIVQDLMEKEERTDGGDDPQLALEWIVDSYLSCSKNRIELEDWDTARSDAWSACSYSNNQNLEALKCMMTVCQNTNDAMGELQTLKLIHQLLVSGYVATSDSTELNADGIQQRMDKLEEELLKKFKAT